MHISQEMNHEVLLSTFAFGSFSFVLNQIYVNWDNMQGTSFKKANDLFWLLILISI